MVLFVSVSFFYSFLFKVFVSVYLLLSPLTTVCQLHAISSAISSTNPYNQIQEFILPLHQQLQQQQQPQQQLQQQQPQQLQQQQLQQQVPAVTPLTTVGVAPTPTSTGQSALQRIRGGLTMIPNRLQRVTGGGGVVRHDRDNNSITSTGAAGRLDGAAASAVKMITRDVGMFRFASPRSQSPPSTAVPLLPTPPALPVISIGSALTGMETGGSSSVGGLMSGGGGIARGGVVGGLLRDGGNIIRMSQTPHSTNTAVGNTSSHLMNGVTKTLLGVDAAGNSNLVNGSSGGTTTTGVADAFLYSHHNNNIHTSPGLGTPGYVGVGPI
eukprot:GHVS01083506.1.p1 GENE.GHVS01083506.1~~GHVS01083506.1.p1  ORF type:complete len:325 (+),score=113.27 GHVS01083506.1:355-1329(+)